MHVIIVSYETGGVMGISKYIEYISNHPIFRNIESETISKHFSNESFTQNSYSPSTVIIHPNESNTNIYIVIKGTVEIQCPKAGHRVLLKTSGVGTIFGLANLYAPNETFPTLVSAKTYCEVLVIDHKIFKGMLESEPQIMSNFLVFLSKKVIYLNKKIASYTVGNNEKKLAYFLFENEINGTVSINMSISDIAIMLDMGRASIYRAFDKLEADGLISRQGRNIQILNKEKLKNFI